MTVCAFGCHYAYSSLYLAPLSIVMLKIKPIMLSIVVLKIMSIMLSIVMLKNKSLMLSIVMLRYVHCAEYHYAEK